MDREGVIGIFSGIADPPEHCYTKEEERLLDAQAAEHFGRSARLLREPYPRGIRADIRVIAPAPGRNFQTLMTRGMGAFVMDIPDELIDCELERAELMLCLPAGWKAGRAGESWRWPVEWLRALAHMPAESGAWLGWGHVIPAGEPLGRGAGFTGLLLTDPIAFSEEASFCEMPDGTVVNIYQAIPLYDGEIAYRQAQGTDALLALFEQRLGRDALAVIDTKRRPCAP
ncbi:MAG: suppressor of fused domain protein [Clostridiales Family XIII bacterium]|jgi:hypothetical protein|nr:suppressor of fused domain protein [Clostridiales Family XIII bacterium]